MGLFWNVFSNLIKFVPLVCACVVDPDSSVRIWIQGFLLNRIQTLVFTLIQGSF
jgi:hypothetical protein